MNCAGVVLCGGESRRMGRPKEWLPFGPERMLQRIVRLVSLAAQPVVVVAAPGQLLPELPADVLIAHDQVAGRGPLAGLAAGLAALPDSAELVFAIGVDSPLIRPAWIKRLAELIGSADLAIPTIDGIHQPLAAVYRRRTVILAIERLLQTMRSGLVDLIPLLQTRVVATEELRDIDPDLATLRNINTPEDYRAALAEAGLVEEHEGQN
jgi:molybdenum cofactor guanylyltransferase